jgi:heme/copper-type cytochrome/quinol oxidase subunit 3
MSQILRIILAIATLLIASGAFGLGVWSMVEGKPPVLSATFITLALGFGFFTFHDYKYFFGQK